MSLVAALPVNDHGFGPFLDEFYAAALEPRRFPQALSAFANTFYADYARILVSDRQAAAAGAQIVELGEDADAPPLEASLLSELSTLLAKRESSEANAVRAGVLGAAGWPNEKWAIGGVHYLALTVAVDERWVVSLVALRRNNAFAEHDQAAARRLTDDVRRALSFHFKAARSKSLALSDQLFGARSIALFVTRQKVVEHTNEAAAELVERQGLLRLVGRSLRFEDVRVAAAFDELSKPNLRRTAAKGLAFVVSEGQGTSWLVQLSRQQTNVASPLLSDAASSTLVVVALTPLNGTASSRGALIDGFVDLTATERAVLAAFVDGKDIAAIAGEMQRSIETVRWHVRNLFAKLGVNSQAELTRLGSLLLPI